MNTPGSYTDSSASSTVSGDAAFVATAETTTSTSYTDLTTPGPAAAATVGASGVVYVALDAVIKNTVSNAFSGFCGVALSGANTVAAADAAAGVVNGSVIQLGAQRLKSTGLSTGSTTFTAKYRVDGQTFQFSNRSVAAVCP